MRRIFHASALLLLWSTFAHAVKHHRHVPWSNPLPGSHASLLKQNAEIDRLQLPRIVNAEQLRQLIATGELVPIRATQSLRVSVASTAAYCRPWTLQLLTEAAHDYYARFGAPLTVTSAVRTQEQQRALRTFNGNAAPDTGETASSHMAGISVDIGRSTMSAKQQQWFTEYLRRLRDAGRVEVAMERRQQCYHVAVIQK